MQPGEPRVLNEAREAGLKHGVSVPLFGHSGGYLSYRLRPGSTMPTLSIVSVISTHWLGRFILRLQRSRLHRTQMRCANCPIQAKQDCLRRVRRKTILGNRSHTESKREYRQLSRQERNAKAWDEQQYPLRCRADPPPVRETEPSRALPRAAWRQASPDERLWPGGARRANMRLGESQAISSASTHAPRRTALASWRFRSRPCHQVPAKGSDSCATSHCLAPLQGLVDIALVPHGDVPRCRGLRLSRSVHADRQALQARRCPVAEAPHPGAFASVRPAPEESPHQRCQAVASKQRAGCPRRHPGVVCAQCARARQDLHPC
ncbi:hypothetical protein ABIC07_009088 [Bradyrhizobium sp. RT9a]